MKRLYSLIVLLLTGTILFGQGGPSNLPASKANDPMTVSPSSNQNYILTTTYLTPAGSNTTAGAASPEIQYFDGLGRPIEKVEVKSSQNGYDVILMQTYDAFGNPEKTYLPYSKSGNNGAFVNSSSFISEQNTFLSGLYGSTDGPKGYSTAEYEKSPLNRLIKQYSPGNDWQTRPVITDYNTNKDTIVQSWVYSGDSYSAYTYLNGSLFLTTVTDEDGKKVKEYKDKQGKVVLSKTSSSETRYCYDSFDRLRCVVPPTATGPGDANNVYSYKYDSRGRLIEKKIPGSLPVYLVYDARDRLVLTQNGNQRYNGSLWRYVIYDDLNRPVEEGNLASSLTQDNLTYLLSSSLNYIQGLTRNVYRYLYYDNYNSFPSGNAPYSNDITALGVTQATGNKGRLTGENVKLLDTESDMTPWLFKAYYYDKYGRLIQTVADNHLGGKDYITNKYNFIGQLTQSRYRHVADGVTTYVDQYSDYDHRGRLAKTRMSINGTGEVLLAGNSYNEADNLIAKYLHSESGSAFIQRNDYTYNIRNWLTGINDPASFSENDKFGLKLEYNSVTSPSAVICYNGNIASMVWGTPTNSNMRYNLSYDPLNRLTQALFSKTGYNASAFQETYRYDKNGNILNLYRYTSGGGILDNLTMVYSANQISSITDLGPNPGGDTGYPGSYRPGWHYYDYNGNLAYECCKLLSINSNLLNLPSYMYSQWKNCKNTYFYTFDGEKSRKTTEGSGTVTKLDYCGPFVYQTVSGVRSLKYIVTPEGRAVKNGTSWEYEYNLADHLGNVRAVIKKGTGGVAELVQEKHYYPFGMEISELSSGTSTNKYLYNGKELENEFVQYYYDYGARFYDPELGRWHTPDPLAESYYSQSPYHFAGNNPMLFLDANGMDYWSTNDPNEIARFLSGMRSGQGGFKSFDFKGWNHATDAEFTGNLTYNDESNMFYSSYGTVQNDEATRVGISISGIVNSDTGNAGFLSEAGASWLGKSSGRTEEPIIDPIDFIAGGIGSLKALVTKGFTKISAETEISALEKGVNVASTVIRSQAEKTKFLKSLAESGKYPKWMNQWLTKGKVPPGYNVEHIRPLSIGGEDLISNMRLNTISNHRLIHKYYHPWRK